MAQRDASKEVLTAEGVFDSIGPAYEAAYAGLRPQLETIEWVLSQLGDIKPAKILDVGCGTGRPVCSTFADAGHDVLGIDVSAVMLEDARAKVPNAKFMKADAYQVDISPSTYDAITAYFSLIADVTQEQLRIQIRRMHDWLKPGGLFVIAAVPIYGDLELTSFLGRSCRASSFTAEGYVACIEEAGMEVISAKTSVFMPKAVEVGICKPDEVIEEPHLFVCAKKR